MEQLTNDQLISIIQGGPGIHGADDRDLHAAAKAELLKRISPKRCIEEEFKSAFDELKERTGSKAAYSFCKPFHLGNFQSRATVSETNQIDSIFNVSAVEKEIHLVQSHLMRLKNLADQVVKAIDNIKCPSK